MTLPVTTTTQPFGGVRRWWRCPICRTRRGVLLVAAPDGPIACRNCLHAAYLIDYPGRRHTRQLTTLLRGFIADGSLTLDERGDRELDLLLAKRRRGVRRGRRVVLRALRRLAGMTKEPDAIISLLREYS